MHVVYIVTQTVFILGKVFGYLDWSWLFVAIGVCTNVCNYWYVGCKLCISLLLL